MSSGLLFILILLSPIGVAFHFYSQVMRHIYDPMSDTIAIPIFGFVMMVFPFQFVMWLNGRKHKPTFAFVFWERLKPVDSALSLILLVCPIGLYWLAIMADAMATLAIPSIFYALIMLYVSVMVRSRLLLFGRECALESHSTSRPL